MANMAPIARTVILPLNVGVVVIAKCFHVFSIVAVTRSPYTVFRGRLPELTPTEYRIRNTEYG